MEKLLYIILLLLQWTLGIVQNLLGLGLFLVIKIKKTGCRAYFYHGTLVCHWNREDSMALGMFIFFGHSNNLNANRILAHEYGHTVQSRITGPLYLIVIGLPSLLWARRHSNIQKRKKMGVSYYSYYTEKWRNYLAHMLIHEDTPE